MAGLHESAVHGLPSSQLRGAPAQLPAAHVSLMVHALPSLHETLLNTCMHPVAGSQLSSVQTLASLQFVGGPPTHAPPRQASLVVQRLPSLHAAVLFTCLQPVAGSDVEVSCHLYHAPDAASP